MSASSERGQERRQVWNLEVVTRLNGDIWLYDADDDAPLVRFYQDKEYSLRLAHAIVAALSEG